MRSEKERVRRLNAVAAAIGMVAREYHLAGRDPNGDPDYREMLKLQERLRAEDCEVVL